MLRLYKAAVESGNMVTIKPGAVESKGTTVFSSSETDFAPFIREAYKHLGENNMKFYKMDNLCKLGYVAAGYLLKDTNYRSERDWNHSCQCIFLSGYGLQTSSNHQ